MNAAPRLELTALAPFPLVQAGDDIVALLIDVAEESGVELAAGDVLVIAQKIVSKAEGRLVQLAEVEPSARARELAAATGKDPRLVELVLSESSEVLRHRPGVLIVAHRLGFVLANAGIDRSNVASDPADETVLMLPVDPDGTAAAIRRALRDRIGVETAVIINDSVGRAWRNGTVGIALGAAGLPAFDNLIGQPDLFGRPLQVSQTGLADAIAAAAGLVQGEADEGRPVVLVRGFRPFASHRPAADLVRPLHEDLFR